MKRLIDYYLTQWRTNLEHKPLLLRGARQVGKTYAARSLAPAFETFIEINFEQKPRFSAFFETDLDANRIVRDIEITTGKVITPGKTLLFFDEIQNAPKVISALRYFYEQIPQLHIIAAGSLLEFQLESVGMPVGRVQSFFMQPLSFLEFLVARNETKIALYLQEIDHQSVSSPVHEKILGLYGEYMAVGGLPEATYHWCQHKSFKHIEEIQRTLVETYRQDFEKYGRQGRIEHLLHNIPRSGTLYRKGPAGDSENIRLDTVPQTGTFLLSVGKGAGCCRNACRVIRKPNNPTANV